MRLPKITAPRVALELGATWRRSCWIKATLRIVRPCMEDTIQGLALNEFLLLLSSTGLACRRCQLEAVNGGDIAVRFCA
jgi:hypothetical protein